MRFAYGDTEGGMRTSRLARHRSTGRSHKRPGTTRAAATGRGGAPRAPTAAIESMSV
jgi:hypothetical protein